MCKSIRACSKEPYSSVWNKHGSLRLHVRLRGGGENEAHGGLEKEM